MEDGIKNLCFEISLLVDNICEHWRQDFDGLACFILSRNQIPMQCSFLIKTG